MKDLNSQPLPMLTKKLSKPMVSLKNYVAENSAAIDTWFEKQWHLTPPSLYASVDIRNSGYKIAPVDTNLFPAGFNNLHNSLLHEGVNAAKKYLAQYFPKIKKILIVPESHTRNMMYFENLAVFQKILVTAGFEAHIGFLLEELTSSREISLPSGNKIVLEPLARAGDFLILSDFVPDIIVTNNDFSSGIPAILKNLQQPLIPSLTVGWSTRLKSTHFSLYQTVCEEFATFADIDPWLINPLSRDCQNIDFATGTGKECLAQTTEELFTDIKKKYREYHITDKPFAIVKADMGTYGMSVMTVKDPTELLHLNRKQRTHMSTAKGNRLVNKVIIQEGIYTYEIISDTHMVAEPVVYLIGGKCIGGFYRAHTSRGPDENLNSPGMLFQSIEMNFTAAQAKDGLNPLFSVYGIIGKLAVLAAAREIQLAEGGVSS